MSDNMTASGKVLVALAGMAGAIGTTFAIGLALSRHRQLPNAGLTSESSTFRRFFRQIPGLENWEVVGWDPCDEELLTAAQRHRCCSSPMLESASPILSEIRPRSPLMPGPGAGSRLLREADWLRSRAEAIGASDIVIINVCPTEPIQEQTEAGQPDWSDLSSLDTSTQGVTVSRLYFRLAIEVGAAHINFTPNVAETQALRCLADERQILYCGRDGKTGQTFLKTVIAPALRDRNLMVDGWFSLNLLGNEDGKALRADDRGATKKKSKRDCLASILGYTPGEAEDDDYSHQIHIHYYPPRGDSKEAWDNIDFRGFLDEPMQLKLNWLGKDSVLAAPFLIDLVRVLLLARRGDESGLVESAAFFFKQPLTAGDKPAVHEVAEQTTRLRDYLRQLCLYGDASLIPILGHLVQRGRKRRVSLSLHASECRMTAASALSLASDLASRYCLPDPGDADPGDIIFGDARSLEPIVEQTSSSLGRMLGAEFVDLSPLSGFHAADLLLTAFSRPGDHVFLVHFDHGGHPEMVGLAEQLGAHVSFIPYAGMTPDWPALAEMVEVRRPRLVYVNASDYLSAAALTNFVRPKCSDTIFAFDVSQTLGLMLGGVLPTPFDVGYDCVVGSTHKTFPGPHKGFFAARSRAILDRFSSAARTKVSSTHTHHILSLGIALAEFDEYGPVFAKRTVALANALAECLAGLGYAPVRLGSRFTETHQIWLPAPDKDTAILWFRRLEQANIFVNYRQLPFGLGYGLRIGLQEAAMLGLDIEHIRGLGAIMAECIAGVAEAPQCRARLRLMLASITPLYETPAHMLDAVLEVLPWQHSR
jgi:myo-inositol-1-phosphate synthase